MRLFISYRRSDSIHAANRVRMCLQMKFGIDAVFIDREIPPGHLWEEHLEKMLDESTGVVVLVGDEFLRLLRRSKTGEASDPMVWEIATAIRLQKRIYPVLFGAIDMPDAAQLPEAMRAFAGYQAVFAREPAFDSAIAVMMKSIAEDEGWVEAAATPAAASTAVASPPSWGLGLPALALTLAFAAAVAAWVAGRLILWLADPQAATGQPAESAFWHGARYGLSTTLWGLGPYLAYWLVAELRARARLPIFNLHGLLTVCNVAGILLSGGTFLLLSTLPGWHLEPLWLFPERPGSIAYALLALALLGIVVTTVAVVMWEPLVRKLDAAGKARGMHRINTISAGLVVSGLWFAASLAHSLPALGTSDPVPVVGYLMLCPAMSLLIGSWQYSQARLGQKSGWQVRCLLYLIVGLYLACTLALFAYGPTRLLAPI